MKPRAIQALSEIFKNEAEFFSALQKFLNFKVLVDQNDATIKRKWLNEIEKLLTSVEYTNLIQLIDQPNHEKESFDYLYKLYQSKLADVLKKTPEPKKQEIIDKMNNFGEGSVLFLNSINPTLNVLSSSGYSIDVLNPFSQEALEKWKSNNSIGSILFAYNIKEKQWRTYSLGTEVTSAVTGSRYLSLLPDSDQAIENFNTKSLQAEVIKEKFELWQNNNPIGSILYQRDQISGQWKCFIKQDSQKLKEIELSSTTPYIDYLNSLVAFDNNQSVLDPATLLMKNIDYNQFLPHLKNDKANKEFYNYPQFSELLSPIINLKKLMDDRWQQHGLDRIEKLANQKDSKISTNEFNSFNQDIHHLNTVLNFIQPPSTLPLMQQSTNNQSYSHRYSQGIASEIFESNFLEHVRQIHQIIVGQKLNVYDVTLKVKAALIKAGFEVPKTRLLLIAKDKDPSQCIVPGGIVLKQVFNHEKQENYFNAYWLDKEGHIISKEVTSNSFQGLKELDFPAEGSTEPVETDAAFNEEIAKYCNCSFDDYLNSLTRNASHYPGNTHDALNLLYKDILASKLPSLKTLFSISMNQNAFEKLYQSEVVETLENKPASVNIIYKRRVIAQSMWKIIGMASPIINLKNKISGINTAITNELDNTSALVTKRLGNMRLNYEELLSNLEKNSDTSYPYVSEILDIIKSISTAANDVSYTSDELANITKAESKFNQTLALTHNKVNSISSSKNKSEARTPPRTLTKEQSRNNFNASVYGNHSPRKLFTNIDKQDYRKSVSLTSALGHSVFNRTNTFSNQVATDILLPTVIKVLRILDCYLTETPMGQEIAKEIAFKSTLSDLGITKAKQLQRFIINIYLSQSIGAKDSIQNEINAILAEIPQDDSLYSLLSGLSIYIKKSNTKNFINTENLDNQQLQGILGLNVASLSDLEYYYRHIIQHVASIFIKYSKDISKKWFIAHSHEAQMECDTIITLLDNLMQMPPDQLTEKIFAGLGITEKPDNKAAPLIDYLLKEINEALHHGTAVPTALLKSKPFMDTAKQAYNFLKLLQNRNSDNLENDFTRFMEPQYRFKSNKPLASTNSTLNSNPSPERKKENIDPLHNENFSLEAQRRSDNQSSHSSLYSSSNHEEILEIPNNSEVMNMFAQFLRIFDYYSDTLDGQALVEKINHSASNAITRNNDRSKQKWQRLLRETSNKLVKLYYQNKLSKNDFIAEVNYLAQTIQNNIGGKNSRLRKTLKLLMKQWNGEQVSNITGTLPIELLDFNNQFFKDQAIEQLLTQQKLFQASNDILIVNLLRITDYYLNNEISRILQLDNQYEDSEKVIRCNTKPRFLREAENLIAFLIKAKQDNLPRESILKHIDNLRNVINNSRFIGKNSSRFAESLALLSYQFGGNSIPRKGKKHFPLGKGKLIDLDMSPEEINQYVKHHQDGQQSLLSPDRVNTLQLLGILLRINAYYQNTSLGQALIRITQENNRQSRLGENYRKGWINQMSELAKFALQIYHKEPTHAHERILLKMRDIAKEIRSHRIGGQNSLLATTLERLANNYDSGSNYKAYSCKDDIDREKIVTLCNDIIMVEKTTSKILLTKEEAEDAILCTVLDHVIGIMQKYQDKIAARYRNTLPLKQNAVGLIIKDLNTIYGAPSYESRKYRMLKCLEDNSKKSKRRDILNGIDEPLTIPADKISQTVDTRRFIEIIISSHTHRVGGFNSIFAEGDFGKALKEVTNYLDSIAPEDISAEEEITMFSYNKTIKAV